MDTVSMLFASFLTSMTNSIHTHVSDVMGTELQINIVEYQEHKIDYQYQLWKIKPESVCSTKKAELVDQYSACTIAAKSMFNETCSYLTQNPQNHWKYTKLKNMYCSSAVTYIPVTATISRPSENEAEVLEAKQACSILTLQARQESSAVLENKRKIACENVKKVIEKHN